MPVSGEAEATLLPLSCSVRGLTSTGGGPKVSLEFMAAEWAPFFNVAFVARGGTAYVDDFALVERQPEPPRR